MTSILDLGPICEWYARCGNAAVGTSPHPILGAVPICERCAKKHNLRVDAFPAR